MLRIILALLPLCGCFAEQAGEGRVSGTDYGPLRAPEGLYRKQDPVVPTGKADQEEESPPKPAEAPKKDSCSRPCADLAEANENCGSWTASCNRLAATIGTNNDTCREKKLACDAADAAQSKAQGKGCSC